MIFINNVIEYYSLLSSNFGYKITNKDTASAAWGTKNNAASLDLRSSFVATRQSPNTFGSALT